jgi:hypothetical protein
MLCGQLIYNYNPFASSFPPEQQSFLHTIINLQPTKNLFSEERGQTKDLQFCVIMLFLSLFPISSHIFTLDVCSIFLYMLILLLIFAGVLTFNPCVNQVQSFCVILRSQVGIGREPKVVSNEVLALAQPKLEN